MLSSMQHLLSDIPTVPDRWSLQGVLIEYFETDEKIPCRIDES